MFVRVVQKSNDHVSVRVVENKRVGKKVKQKTICCVGHTHKDKIEKIEFLKKLGLDYQRFKVGGSISFRGDERHLFS